MIDAKVRAHYVDDRASSVRAPLVVRHVWRNAGGDTEEHVERVAAPGEAHRYTVTCGREPALRSIVMEAGSVPR